ncbi:MAG: DUF4093 domain-containing protein [Oscillospiraceae bacterium]|nr:DUF4093 domain-containing protein [Oscillospiraceae bacterium]
MVIMKKIKIKQAVIVEGKCDKNVLESVIDAVIIPVNGFGVYKNKDKLSLIRRYAEKDGVIILTDSDNAGRQIRNYLKNVLSGDCEVVHVYVPNLLEVEDTATDVLRAAISRFADDSTVTIADDNRYTRQRLFEDGFIGGAGSAKKRRELLAAMGLPANLSVTALLDVLGRFGSDEYERVVADSVEKVI